MENMDDPIENSKRSLPGYLIEELESDEIPVGVPFGRVTLVQNPECDRIDAGETVIVNGEAPETIGYLIGPSDEGQDVCQDERSGEPTGFLNVNPECILTDNDLKKLRISYDIPSNVEMRLPKYYERADWDMGDWVCLYKAAFDCGFRFPFTPLVTEILSFYGISPGQLMPNGWRLLLSLEHFTEKFGIIVDPIIFRKRYYAKDHEKEKGRVLFVCRTGKKPFVTCLTKADDSDWKKVYFFFRGDGLFESGVEKSFPFSWQILSEC